MRRTDSYNLARLRESIKPFRLHFFPRLCSTNDHALLMRRRRKLYAPSMVLAGIQTHGRGRGSNEWWSNPGCITVTFVLPVHEHHSAHRTPLIAGVALRRAIDQFAAPAHIQLKWPNDLLFEGRKLAGLLCERMDRVDLIGLGLNVNVMRHEVPRRLRYDSASLLQVTNRQHDRTDVLIAIARALHSLMLRRASYPFPAILREYNQHHYLSGRRVSVVVQRDLRPIRGTCVGLDATGRLLLRQRARQVRVVAGNVQVD